MAQNLPVSDMTEDQCLWLGRWIPWLLLAPLGWGSMESRWGPLLLGGGQGEQQAGLMGGLMPGLSHGLGLAGGLLGHIVTAHPTDWQGWSVGDRWDGGRGDTGIHRLANLWCGYGSLS